MAFIETERKVRWYVMPYYVDVLFACKDIHIISCKHIRLCLSLLPFLSGEDIEVFDE